MPSFSYIYGMVDISAWHKHTFLPIFLHAMLGIWKNIRTFAEVKALCTEKRETHTEVSPYHCNGNCFYQWCKRFWFHPPGESGLWGMHRYGIPLGGRHGLCARTLRLEADTRLEQRDTLAKTWQEEKQHTQLPHIFHFRRWFPYALRAIFRS